MSRKPAGAHLYVHIEPMRLRPSPTTTKANKQIAEIHSMITALTQGAQAMAADLTELQTQVEQNTSVTQSAVALLDGLKAQLDAAGTDPAALSALSAALGSNSQSLADALTRNTPAEDQTGA